MDARHQSCRDSLDRDLFSAYLSCKQHASVFLHLERLAQKRGSVDVGVAMNLTVTDESGIFQPGNQPQNTRLLAELQVILKSDQIVRVRTQIFLAQLDHRMWHQPGTRVFQSDWLHRADAQRIPRTASDLYNRQAALEVIQLLPVALFHRLS